MEQNYYTTELNHQIIISLLKSHGISKVVASPGTTNISFVGSIQNDPFFKIYSSVDERSAAYMACGLAAETGEPVVLSCTGATASRNYMPGLTEAYYRKLPILAITSSPPIQRVGHNFPQVIDRQSQPNDVVKISVILPVINTPDEEWNCEILANKAILELKRYGGGPVHINLITTYSRDFSVNKLPSMRVIDRISMNDSFPKMPEGRIGIFVGSHKIWNRELTEAVDAFCASNNAVVFCDHTSGYKGKYRLLYSLVASQDNYRTKLTKLDVLIYIGDISGDYSVSSISARQTWRVSEDGELRDLFHTLHYVFEMPEEVFFRHYLKNTEPANSFLDQCHAEQELIGEKIPEKLAQIPFSNIWMAAQMAPSLPKNSVLHLGILNSLRSWNFFEIPESVLAFSNVGGFGIDGNLSSLIGASVANPDKLYFGIVGDLAFFYDMNVIGNRHIGKNVRIMLVNNGCGTEFRNYNNVGQVVFGDTADAYIAAAGHNGNQSHKLVKHYAEDLGYEYLSAATKKEFLAVYERFLIDEITDKPMILEVFTNHEDESDALIEIRNCISNSSGIMMNRGINAAKHVLGESGFHSAVKVAKKLHITPP
ncbi:MAG: thiamine pyrophosphate-binding protein [Eubacteriales bacterium]|nr:thiamine pyrophosphate-binding protein [Eubacteriales bacterium]